MRHESHQAIPAPPDPVRRSRAVGLLAAASTADARTRTWSGSGTSASLELSAGRFSIASGYLLTFDARLRQNGSGLLCSKSGQGTLVFSGDNSGTTGWSSDGSSVSQGVLRFTADGAFGTSGNDYAVASNAALELSGGVSQLVAAGGGVALSGTSVGGGFSSWIAGTFANGGVPSGKKGPNDHPDNRYLPMGWRVDSFPCPMGRHLGPSIRKKRFFSPSRVMVRACGPFSGARMSGGTGAH